MEKGDKGSKLTRMGVSGWMFLLVPAYPGCPGQTAVKWLLLLLLLLLFMGYISALTYYYLLLITSQSCHASKQKPRSSTIGVIRCVRMLSWCCWCVHAACAPTIPNCRYCSQTACWKHQCYAGYGINMDADDMFCHSTSRSRQGLCSGTVSVRLSVPAWTHSSKPAAPRCQHT